ncbi:MAG: phosphoenolpyruvate--protein phosphotransferase [Clostridia bacterium]|nr:phosphoenolpyruvate--protein phosphotransferase [Clostridia bacterium]
MIYKGIAGAEGIGIGKALVVREQTLDYSQVVFSGAENETERLQAAIAAFCEKISSMQQHLTASVGEKQAEILNGQIMMIQDPFMTSQMQDFIAGGQCAEAAVDAVCNMYIEMFSSVEDDLTRQRATDIRDMRARLLGILLGQTEVDLSDLPPETVLVAHDFTPSMTANMQKEHIVGILSETGSKTSHSAILARSLEIPAVMSVENICTLLQDGDTVIADGTRGEAVVRPAQGILEAYASKREQLKTEKQALRAFAGKKTATADGKQLAVYANIGKPDDVSAVLQNDGEGVGLFRTEFLFMDRAALPSEEEQFAAYRAVAAQMQGKEVIIRTLDVGGDKDIPYLHMEKEENPFLGHRAVRYCLDNPEIYKVQLRALLRASAYGNIKIMLPLVTTVSEVRRVRELLESAKAELRAENIKFHEKIPVGVMIETPAAAMTADLLAKEADFFSIGTNDLTQYAMAVDRGNSKVSALYSHYNPAVLRLIKQTADAANRAGIPVGMCGEAAGDKALIPLLIAFGLHEFSVTPAAVLATRKTVSLWSKTDADALAERVLTLSTAEDVAAALESAART